MCRARKPGQRHSAHARRRLPEASFSVSRPGVARPVIRAALNQGEYLDAADKCYRLALHATLETLATIKNPPNVAIVQQAGRDRWRTAGRWNGGAGKASTLELGSRGRDQQDPERVAVGGAFSHAASISESLATTSGGAYRLVRPMSHYMDSARLKLVKVLKLTRLSLTSGTGSQIEEFPFLRNSRRCWLRCVPTRSFKKRRSDERSSGKTHGGVE
jgi:hypothetical protein